MNGINSIDCAVSFKGDLKAPKSEKDKIFVKAFLRLAKHGVLTHIDVDPVRVYEVKGDVGSATLSLKFLPDNKYEAKIIADRGENQRFVESSSLEDTMRSLEDFMSDNVCVSEYKKDCIPCQRDIQYE